MILGIGEWNRSTASDHDHEWRRCKILPPLIRMLSSSNNQIVSVRCYDDGMTSIEFSSLEPLFISLEGFIFRYKDDDKDIYEIYKKCIIHTEECLDCLVKKGYLDIEDND